MAGRPVELGQCAPAPGERLLLRAGLLDCAGALTAWQQWRASHDLEQAHWRSEALFPLVAANLGESLGSDADRLRMTRRRTSRDNQLTRAALADALDTLEAVGVTGLVVKGAALEAEVYPPGVRVMGDADLVVGPSAFMPAIDALQAAGWRPLNRMVGVESMRALSLASPRNGAIDVHRWVVYAHYTRRPESALWQHSRNIEIMGRPARALDFADATVIAVLHGTNPHEASAVRWPADVVMLERRAIAVGDPDFWARTVETALELGVGKVVGQCLAWCRDELDIGIDAASLDRCRAQPLDRWLDAEWLAKRHGFKVRSHVRGYIDRTRGVGMSPSAAGYARLRYGLLKEGGGVLAFARYRARTAREIIANRHARRTTW